MSMSNTTKLIISVCLLAAPLACDDGGDPPAAPDAGEDRDALFVADPPRTDEVVLARADAELLAEVDLAGGGRVVFIDEDPGSDTPAIAVVAVEPDDGPSVIDGLVAGRTSPLDLYRAIAPATAEVPEVLVRAHAARDVATTLGAAVGPVADGSETTDDPNDCDDAGAWAWSFNLWSLVAQGRVHLGNIEVPGTTDSFASFGTYDHVWAGVCVRTFGISPTTISMQRWNGGAYEFIPFSMQHVPLHHRYRYYGFSPNSSTRRLRIHGWGGASGPNKLIVSGAWAEPEIQL